MPVDPSANEPAPAVLALSEMAAQLTPVAWLWPGWVPSGLLTLLCAAPGAGKSYLALDLARRLIHGEPFPDGSPPSGPPANVLYVDAERTPQVINERAVAWNMDRTRLFLFVPKPAEIYEMCAKWIMETLKEEDKPLTPTDLICRAERIGYSRATVFRARDLLGRQIVDTRGRRHPENRWALPGMPSKT